MIFKRKLYNKLLAWKQQAAGTKALLIEGVCRIGKSTLVEEFAKNEYRSYLLIKKFLWNKGSTQKPCCCSGNT